MNQIQTPIQQNKENKENIGPTKEAKAIKTKTNRQNKSRHIQSSISQP
jgi:hypothetical protein